MAAQFEAFNIRRTSNLDFEVVQEIGRKNTTEVIWGSDNSIEESI
jgi:hypothetical protein